MQTLPEQTRISVRIKKIANNNLIKSLHLQLAIIKDYDGTDPSSHALTPITANTLPDEAVRIKARANDKQH